MNETDKRRNDMLIRAIGLVSILIGGYMMIMYTITDTVEMQEAKGLMLGHSALMVGGIIMLFHIPLHPFVEVRPELEEMARDYGALITAMLSVGICFMLWGFYDMISLGFTGRRMMCFMLGIIPLASILLTNSRTVEWMSVLWKVSMSLVIGLLVLPFISGSLSPPQMLFITLTIIGNLLCITLVHVNEPFLRTYLEAREEGIRSMDCRFRSRELYLSITLAMTVFSSMVLLSLYLGFAMDHSYIPPGILDIDPAVLMRVMLMYGCLTGGIFGWYLTTCCLRMHCYDSSKYTITIMIGAICEVIGLIAVYLMTAAHLTFTAMILLLLLMTAGGAVLSVASCRCCRRRRSMSEEPGEES